VLYPGTAHLTVVSRPAALQVLYLNRVAGDRASRNHSTGFNEISAEPGRFAAAPH
jgi:hypothetical protein